ncbi:MAG: tryptophan--tRNA ligase [Chloroflexi bacterium]|nr:tryptophan--tRNA ligase [Chloroflexota bacterium]
MTQRKNSLTGVKPSGTPHIGNYLGAIQPALELSKTYKAHYFLADYHALTTMRDPAEFRHANHELAATWLACGLDPDDVVFYRQSDIPEIFELTWILACNAPKGLLNRAHAYKAAADANTETGRLVDDGINMGLYNYPILMAADILIADTDLVPVGQDQKQHIEITRDIAIAFNAVYGDTLVLPDGLISEEVATITGLDGRKMSKSYGNVIPLFAPPDELRKTVMRIVTDSRRPEDPKDPDQDNIYAIYKHFAAPERLAEVRALYLNGGLAYGKMKAELFEVLNAYLSPMRAKYDALMADTAQIDAILADGAVKMREIAAGVMDRVRAAVGKSAVPTVEKVRGQ